jgi:hypothetical protein
VFGKNKKTIYANADHDPSEYRVCPHLHPLHRFELPSTKGTFIAYACDECMDNGEPCIRIPHRERMEGGRATLYARTIGEFVTKIWIWISVLTFGIIDPYGFHADRLREEERERENKAQKK